MEPAHKLGVLLDIYAPNITIGEHHAKINTAGDFITNKDGDSELRRIREVVLT